MVPVALIRYFHDSQLALLSYDKLGRVLTIRIEKEIGPEVGLIRFSHVSFVLLPTAIPGEAIRSYALREADESFWIRCQLDEREFENDDLVYEIESQDGPKYFVVAKSITYDVTN